MVGGGFSGPNSASGNPSNVAGPSAPPDNRPVPSYEGKGKGKAATTPKSASQPKSFSTPVALSDSVVENVSAPPPPGRKMVMAPATPGRDEPLKYYARLFEAPAPSPPVAPPAPKRPARQLDEVYDDDDEDARPAKLRKS